MARKSKIDLFKKLAFLEFAHDQLSTELSYVDSLLRSLGFPEGRESAKVVAHQLLAESGEVPEVFQLVLKKQSTKSTNKKEYGYEK